MSKGLKNPDRNERARAVRALGGSQDRAGAVHALEAVLRHDPDRRVRIYAADSLGHLGGPEATALLVEKAASTDESVVRTAALTVIETIRDPSAIPGLINLFRLNRGDDDVKAQFGASQALLNMRTPGVPQLLQALNDPSAKVRGAVVEVLGRMGAAGWATPEVADRITSLQADPDPGVQQAVAVALATLKGKPEPKMP